MKVQQAIDWLLEQAEADTLEDPLTLEENERIKSRKYTDVSLRI